LHVGQVGARGSEGIEAENLGVAGTD